jgi:hypothetical protein
MGHYRELRDAYGGAVSDACMGVPVTVPVGRVTEAEQETRVLLEALQQGLAGLEANIAPVLRSASPSPNGTGCEKQREPSPFASSLIANNQKLRGLVEYVRDLSTRVDF